MRLRTIEFSPFSLEINHNDVILSSVFLCTNALYAYARSRFVPRITVWNSNVCPLSSSAIDIARHGTGNPPVGLSKCIVLWIIEDTSYDIHSDLVHRKYDGTESFTNFNPNYSVNIHHILHSYYI